jgi:hemoglobin
MHTIQRLIAITALATLATLSLGTSALAQTAQPATPADDSLYQQFGAQPGLVKLMDDFMARLIADPRTHPFFKDVNQAHVKEQLVVQLCEVSGGPCKRKGPDMAKVHAGFDIDRAAFNALVEVLQQAMEAQGIPFGAQNRMLAQLAPMHRDIVNVK